MELKIVTIIAVVSGSKSPTQARSIPPDGFALQFDRGTIWRRAPHSELRKIEAIKARESK
jgi:hypothetical protein